MSYVLTALADRVATVTLNDPDKRNAVNIPMNDELVEVFDELEADDGVGAVVLTGTPPAFSAGADLDALLAGTDPESLQRIYAGFLRVAASPLPTLAAVNGPAVGAGMNFALACDVILAGRAARFDTRFLQIGIHPGGGHTWRLRRLAGYHATMAMVLFGERAKGEDAERIGLAWRCFDDADLLDQAHAMAARVASFSPELVRRTKQTILSMDAVTSGDAAVELETGPQSWSAGQPEFRELVAQLQAKISR